LLGVQKCSAKEQAPIFRPGSLPVLSANESI
jgi:hypothetical protein